MLQELEGLGHQQGQIAEGESDGVCPPLEPLQTPSVQAGGWTLPAPGSQPFPPGPPTVPPPACRLLSRILSSLGLGRRSAWGDLACGQKASPGRDNVRGAPERPGPWREEGASPALPRSLISCRIRSLINPYLPSRRRVSRHTVQDD